MDSSFWFDTINLGVSGYNLKKKYCVFLSEDLFTITNCVAFRLGLHCFYKYQLRGFPNTNDSNLGKNQQTAKTQKTPPCMQRVHLCSVSSLILQ